MAVCKLITVYTPPDFPQEKYVARAVGLPGETVRIAAGDIYVNDKLMAKTPGRLEELWLRLHDTSSASKSADAEGAWRPDNDGWRFEDDGGFTSMPHRTGSLIFAREITDMLPYNLIEFRSNHWSRNTLVGDVRVTLDVAEIDGSGTLEFVQQFGDRRTVATMKPDGSVELSVRWTHVEGARDSADDEGSISVAGALSEPIAMRPLAFAIRDGWVYLQHGDEVVASLDARKDATTAESTQSRATEDYELAIMTNQCATHISRILVERDNYYLDAEEVDAFEPFVTTIPLGRDEYFFLMDSSAIAKDCRFSGPVREEAIHGIVRSCYWPISRSRTFD